MLLAHGARVTITGRSPIRGRKSSRRSNDAANRVRASGRNRRERGEARHSNRPSREFGPIAILVNNAGQAASAPFLKTDAELWRRMMAVNLDGTFHCTQAALPGMLAAGWGRIVNIASIAGLDGLRLRDGLLRLQTRGGRA